MSKFVLFSKIFRLVCIAFLLAFFSGKTVCQTGNSESSIQANREKTSLLNQSAASQKLEKARRVNQILQELKAMRENFLQTGDFIEIFPTVYYHVTLKEFEYIQSGKFENPAEIMDLIINFYDLYKLNRQSFLQSGISGVQAHWREYYREAAKANDYRKKSWNPLKPLVVLWKIKRILQSSIAAHINFELPCAINRTLQFSETGSDNIYKDFRLSDAVMRTADEAANGDISKALFKTSGTFAKLALNLGARFIFLEHKINRMRLTAWKSGSGKGKRGIYKLCEFN